MIVRTLAKGGAQVQCIALARGLAARGHDVSIVSFYDGGALSADAQAAGLRVWSLKKRSRWDLWGSWQRLNDLIRRQQFDVLYSFLPMENLVGLLAARLRHVPIVWGLRAADVDKWQHGVASWLLYTLQSWFIGCPDALISNSHAAMREFARRRRRVSYVIPNGVDLNRFHIDVGAGRRFRKVHDIGADEPLVGIVARLDPMKDHRTFLLAMAIVRTEHPRARYVIAGKGTPSYTSEMQSLAKSLQLDGQTLWLGEYADTPALFNALNVSVLCSKGEGSPNALTEALACGRSTVATDVGDCAMIIGHHGRVVRKGDPKGLAEAVVAALGDPESCAEERHEFACSHYAIDVAVQKTEAVLAGLVGLTEGK